MRLPLSLFFSTLNNNSHKIFLQAFQFFRSYVLRKIRVSFSLEIMEVSVKYVTAKKSRKQISGNTDLCS